MRGELKLLENIIAFFIIIIIGMIAFIYFATSGAGEQRERAEARETLRAVQTAQALYNLPEIACGSSQTGRCIDSYKADAFADILSDTTDAGILARLTYFSIFGQADIAIRCLCPNEPGTIYEGLDSTSYRQVHVPVLVNDPIERTSYFGWIEVRV